MSKVTVGIIMLLQRLGIPGIVDLHVHFMPQRVQEKVWAFFDQVEAAGAPAWPITYRLPEQQRVEVLRGLGVKAFSTLNYAHRPGMAAWLNDYSTQMAAEYPEVIHSGTFYPEPEAEEIAIGALEAGARIFKIHIQVGGFSPIDPQLTGAWQAVAQAGTPVVIHCGHGPHPGEHTGIEPIYELLEKFPDLILIIAHAGLPDYYAFAQLAAEHRGVYLDTTMVGTDYMEQIAPVPQDYPELIAGLPGKIVLGSDFPSIPYRYEHQLEVLEDWRLGDAWLADVLWHTPRSLVGLD